MKSTKQNCPIVIKCKKYVGKQNRGSNSKFTPDIKYSIYTDTQVSNVIHQQKKTHIKLLLKNILLQGYDTYTYVIYVHIF